MFERYSWRMIALGLALPVLFAISYVKKAKTGAACTNNSACRSDLCLAWVSSSNDDPEPAEKGFCSARCVNDKDCPASFVCAPSPNALVVPNGIASTTTLCLPPTSGDSAE